MAFVYGMMCRGRVLIDEDELLQKRVQTSDPPWQPADPRLQIYPWSEALPYLSSYLKAARGTGYETLTFACLVLRWVYDVAYHRLHHRPAPLLPRSHLS